MSNIKVKTILSKGDSISFENGYIEIKNDTPSYSHLTGAIVVDGGIGVKCLENATSSTSGGALTLGGGIGVLKDSFFGGSLELDSNASTFRIRGIKNDRMFMDTINNKNFYISLDGFTKNIDARGDSLYINYTSASTSSSNGSLVISGGVSINYSENASDASRGGSLTVGGGGSFLGDLYIGKNIYSDDSLYISRIVLGENSYIFGDDNSISINSDENIYVDSKGKIILQNSLTITNDDIEFFNPITIHTTQPSTNISNASVILHGGLSISCSDNASNTSQGGAITIGGGLAVHKDVYIGGEILQIPIGNTYTRPKNGPIGTIRYNTETKQFEGFGSSKTWGTLGGVVDRDHDTKITVDNDLGEDEDTLRFYTNGYERMQIGSTGNISIGTIIPNSSTLSIQSSSGNLLKMQMDNEKAQLQTNFGVRDLEKVWDFYIDLSSNIESQLSVVINEEKLGIFSKDNIRFHKPIYIESNEMHIGNTILKSQQKGITIETEGYKNDIVIKDGNIGIGLDNPQEKLSIAGSIEIGLNRNDFQHFRIGCGESSFYMNGKEDGISLGYNIYEKEKRPVIPNPNLSYNRIIINSKHFGFYTGKRDNKTGDISENSSVYIESNGYVGIGTTNPNASLDINGDLVVYKNVHFKSQSVNGETNDNDASFIIDGTMLVKSPVLFLERFNLKNDIDICGTTTIHSGHSSGNIFNVIGNSVLRGDLNVVGNIVTNSDSYNSLGYMELNGDSNVKDTFTVNGNVVVNNTSSKSLYTNGGIMVDKSIHIGDKLVFTNLDNNVIEFRYNPDIQLFSIGYNSNDLYINTKSSNVLKINESSGDVSLLNSLNVSCVNVVSDKLDALYVKGGVQVDERVHIYSTTSSSDKDTGSLIVNGGVGVRENINVGGNAIVNGNLTVLGKTTYIETENTILKDNIIVLNSAPAGSKDAGIMIERYQKDNDNGEGDVVNDNDYLSFQLHSLEQGNIKLTEVKFPENASFTDDYYVGWWIRVASGFSSNQIRKIIKYNGDSKIATVSAPWSSQNPTDIIHLYNRPYVGLLFNEIHDRFELSSTLKDSGTKTSEYTDTLSLKCKNIIVEDGLNIVSDSRLIKSVEDYTDTNILDKIDQVNGIKYENSASTKKQIGFVAEELRELFPELVSEDDYLSIDYSKMTVVLVQCIKELKKLISCNINK